MLPTDAMLIRGNQVKTTFSPILLIAGLLLTWAPHVLGQNLEMIAAATGADTSTNELSLKGNESAIFVLTGTPATGDAIEIQISSDNGTTWLDHFEGATQIVLDEDNTARRVYGPARWRVMKPATTNAIGARAYTPQ